MDIIELMEKRHSVRSYMDKKIEDEKRRKIDDFVREINDESGLSIEVLYDEPTCFDSLLSRYGKFKNVKNYIAIVGNKKDSFKGGYFGEKLVLYCQSLGLNTCWVAMTHGKSKATIKEGESLLILIALGYGENEGVYHKSKPLEKLSKKDEENEIFDKGIYAASLAPTAINQQKFIFELKNGKVYAKSLFGFYTKIDLGIVVYHFEKVTGMKVNLI